MKQMLDKYKTLKTQKQYLKIIGSNIVNRFGDSIDLIAFTWLVYELTHSPLWSTIIFGINFIPTMFIQPFAGAFVEKLKKRNIMVLCDIIRGITVASVALLYLSNSLTPWYLIFVTLINSSVEAFRVPAGMAIVPRLLDQEYYEKGIALNSSTSRAMELVGTGCAGFIIATLGIHSAILIDAITFILSALIISTIKYKEKVADTTQDNSNYLQTLKEGITYIKNSEIILLITIIGASLNFFLTPFNSFLPNYTDELLKGDSSTLSLLMIAISLGSIIGSFVYPFISEKLSKRKLLIHCFSFQGIFFIITVLVPLNFPGLFSNFIVILLNGLLGIITAATGTYVSVFITSHVDVDYMARVSAVFGALATGSIPVATLIISLLLQATNYINIMIITGIINIVIAFILLKVKQIYLLDK